MTASVSSEDWVNDNTSLVCPLCSCVVDRPNKKDHVLWHDNMNNTFRNIVGSIDDLFALIRNIYSDSRKR